MQKLVASELLLESLQKHEIHLSLLVADTGIWVNPAVHRQRDKLMEAHYDGAVPVDLLKREQDRIAAALLTIANKLETSNVHFDIVERNLGDALDLSRDCAVAYKTAPDHIRRQFNQVFFRRILVNPDTTVRAELAPPFDVLLGAGLASTSVETTDQEPENTKEPTQSSGLLRRPTNSNRSALCHSVLSLAHGLSRTFMVGLTGLEPATP